MYSGKFIMLGLSVDEILYTLNDESDLEKDTDLRQRISDILLRNKYIKGIVQFFEIEAKTANVLLQKCRC